MRPWTLLFPVVAGVTSLAGDALAEETLSMRWPLPAVGTEAAAEGEPPPPQAIDWCASDLEALPGDVCYAKGPTSTSGKRTLVIFLHGLVQDGTNWQHSLQKGMKLAGKRLGFSLLAPRGRTGVGPGKKADTVAWPSNASVRAIEDEVIAEWMAAKDLVEKRDGAAFDEVFVMGFSNGAYYASSLALRGRLDVDGYGVFAGGSAPKGTKAAAKPIKNRKPVFVAIASKDETAKKGRELAKALKELKWPHKVASAPVGHVVADGQLEQSLEFLRGDGKKSKPAATPTKKKDTAAAKPKKTAANKKKKPKKR